MSDMAESDSRQTEIWTVGHSTRSMPEFLETIAPYGIEVVADVRRYPGSRRYPHFNPEAFRAALAEVGIGYAAFPELGGRRKAAADSINTVWRNEAFRGYADYMQTAEFREGIDRLLALARRERTAILCAEAVWWRCHRALISDALRARGAWVVHILSATKSEAHPYTEAARILAGQLTYGPEGQLARAPDS